MTAARRFGMAAATLALVTLGAGAGCSRPAPPLPRPFAEFPWPSEIPDARSRRLCAEADRPDAARDTTYIQCAIEGATFARGVPAPRAVVTVATWNIDRGLNAERQLAVVAAGTAFPVPDVLLLNEADRGCARTQYRDVARQFAERLGYYFVFVTEFVELPPARGKTGPYDPPLCEHGNAIVSRYPLGNVRPLRFVRNHSWYSPPGAPDARQPRLGGRVAIAADVLIGGRLLRVYALHLESEADWEDLREAQAREVVADAASVTGPVVVGGDLNSFFFMTDIATGSTVDASTQVFFRSGFTDAHAGLPLDDRYTAHMLRDVVLDLIFLRGAPVVARGICPDNACEGLSDHLPVWARIELR